MSDKSTSLNKYISETGICSRREADTWIEAGRVKINGIVAQKGNRVLENDQVTIDEKPLQKRPELIYIALHKPPGITCTTDLKDKDNIIDFVNHPERIFPIGRLDKSSTGLILLTNDGDIVNEILREKNNNEKEYIVTVYQPVTQRFVQRMSSGIPILGTVTNNCLVEKIGKSTFKIILTQGLNRQIRRMCEYLNYRVVTLKRIRIMNIHLGDLKVGEWRELTEREIQELKNKLKDK
ncbi:MAG: pseudouridine synthase [Saprospiraceae bacterium]